MWTRNGLMTALVTACWMAAAVAVAGETIPSGADRITVTLDVLLDRLAGPDDQARAMARQVIPRYGVEAIPGLVQLLARDEAAVWRTASICLRDIAFQPAPVAMDRRVTVPPRVAVQRAIAEALASADNENLVRRVLNLVPMVWADEDDPAPIASLLGRSELREAALRALNETATPAALDAIARFAEDPTHDPGARREAALALVGRPGWPDAAARARRLVTDADPGVAAAGARLLAESGDPADAAVLRAAVASLPADLPGPIRFEFWDACLRFADRAARAGGQWELAMAWFREILASAPDTVIASGAIMGLARFGDESVVPDLLMALRRADAGSLEAPVLGALLTLRGRNVARAVQARWEQWPEDFRAAIAEQWGATGGDLEAEWVNDLARNAERPVRLAAIRGMIRGRRLAAAECLAAGFDAFPDEAFEPWELPLRMYAAEMASGDESMKRAASLAALLLVRQSKDGETVDEAMRWIRAYPIPEALDVLRAELKEGKLSGASASALAGLAVALMQQGDREEGSALVLEALRGVTPGESGKILAALAAEGMPDELASQLGILRNWRILGPLPWAMSEGFSGRFSAEPGIDFAASAEGIHGSVTWKTVSETGPLGEVNLAGLLGMVDGAAAVAVTVVSVPEPVKAVLRCGSDDGLKVWVNGQSVFENDCDRGMAPDQDQVPVELKAGENRLTLVITQRAGGWGFQARLTDEGGGPLAFSVVPW
ncbi:MAG: hypothetical protein KBH78_04740 [Candidatus Hydrogenedentes bacterium]|nr:hypothetical protein [Candidatus Hydrogenedentota bacterium]